jgi:hypothetical protein
MASIRERGRFSGILRGEGQEATCTVSATKVTLAGTSESTYTDYSIENVSKALPDGNYQLTVNGETIRIRHEGGGWLSQLC